VVRAYDVILRLYPESFRSRYAAEMLLDFEDGLRAAGKNGVLAVATFVRCAVGDFVVSLFREWIAGRAARVAITTATTLLLWGLALRPWSWRWDIQPGPRVRARFARPVTEIELLMLALLALVSVVVLLLAGQLALSVSFRRRTGGQTPLRATRNRRPGGAATSVRRAADRYAGVRIHLQTRCHS
jgi:hypothetical protein